MFIIIFIYYFMMLSKNTIQCYFLNKNNLSQVTHVKLTNTCDINKLKKESFYIEIQCPNNVGQLY